MAGLPKAVKDQADAADAEMKKIAEGTPVQLVKDVEPTPKDTDTPSPEDKDKKTPPKKEDEPKAPLKQPDEASWKHKYDALDGKFKAQATELNTLRGRLDQAVQTIDNLNSIIAGMGSGPSAPVPEDEGEQAGQTPKSLSAKIDPENFEGYGSEMLDLVKQINSQAELIERLQGQQDTIASTTEQTQHDTYLKNLRDAVPDFNEVNRNPEFIAWLGKLDDLSGRIRQDLLMEAHNNRDATRVARFCNAWKKEAGITTDSSTSTPPDEKPPVTKQPTTPLLENELVPDEAGAGTPPPEKPPLKLVTREEYAQAADKCKKGQMTLEEFQKISNQFQKSIAAGKV